MSPPNYYLINHTRREFCYFEIGISIFNVLDDILKNKKWEKTDDIRIDSEYAGSVALLEYLVNNVEYKDVDVQDYLSV